MQHRTYHRGLVAGLFALDLLVGAFLFFITIIVNFPLFGSERSMTPRDVPAYWLTVLVLALLFAAMLIFVPPIA